MTWIWGILLTNLWIAIRVARSSGSVGCLFTQEICDYGEGCFDDNVFGRCQEEKEEGYQHDLGPQALGQLEKSMSALYADGYRWPNNYTQCIIQHILYTERYMISIDPQICEPFRIPARQRSAHDLATIEFLPSNKQANSDYADELFEPTYLKKRRFVKDNVNELLEDLWNLYDSKEEDLKDLEDADTDGNEIEKVEKEQEEMEPLSHMEDEVTDEQWKAISKGLLSFQRNERLDTKKPGPSFLPRHTFPISMETNPITEKPIKVAEKSHTERPDAWSEAGSVMVEKTKGNLEVIDGSHTFLIIDYKEEISPTEAYLLVKKLEHLLKLPTGAFSNIRVDHDQITFKVNPNPQDLNATIVAAKAEAFQGELAENGGLKVIAAGIGNKDHKFEVISSEVKDKSLFVITFILCGAVMGVLLGGAIIFLVRKHVQSRKKLQSLSQQDTEVSQDYQDLCRQRMQSGHHPESKPEPIHVAQSPKRVSSLSQSEHSQPSPTSRSSTSSWSEEPVISNMDITTGHMILSYMEDHLKTRDKLDKEWEALCAYEAEPCSTNSANVEANRNKNRYPDVLPYDHSRVVLTEGSNVSNSDYINANSVTDHDPRNPAYIATQSPLPHTAADFWQMVWEQGSVVIVMLTRLMENGVAMCHRYWPEEGSDLYHIYEVHLVSEHIWCDEYLVRSFYLKNLKTSETRTVTQFHFLAWPDHGVPSSVKALLEFRRKVNKSYRGRSCPVIVHCSDGIGRTGTYCLIDMVLNRVAKGAKEIDIAATLEHIRDQRGGAVGTKAQFEFVLLAIAEEVHAILKALSSSH